MTTRTDQLLDHKHPTVLIAILQRLNDHAGQPTSNRAYRETERGLEQWGWQRCGGEYPKLKNGDPNYQAKPRPCAAGTVRDGKTTRTCSRCHGKGGYRGDPYDRQQHTIITGPQRPSTVTIADFTRTVLDMAHDPTHEGGKALDRALWKLNTRDTATSTSTRPIETRPEPWCFTAMRQALNELASKQPGWHHLLDRLYIDPTHNHVPTDLERQGARRALALLARLLPDAYRVPDWLRIQAQEAA